eukprot:3933183-Rhodomonas_salina.1
MQCVSCEPCPAGQGRTECSGGSSGFCVSCWQRLHDYVASGSGVAAGKHYGSLLEDCGDVRMDGVTSTIEPEDCATDLCDASVEFLSGCLDGFPGHCEACDFASCGVNETLSECTLCQPCEPVPPFNGNYSSRCQLCPSGQDVVPDETGETFTCGCAPGYGATVSVSGSLVCSPCSEGMFSDVVSVNAECQSCAFGHYTTQSGSSVCHECVDYSYKYGSSGSSSSILGDIFFPENSGMEKDSCYFTCGALGVSRTSGSNAGCEACSGGVDGACNADGLYAEACPTQENPSIQCAQCSKYYVVQQVANRAQFVSKDPATYTAGVDGACDIECLEVAHAWFLHFMFERTETVNALVPEVAQHVSGGNGKLYIRAVIDSTFGDVTCSWLCAPGYVRVLPPGNHDGGVKDGLLGGECVACDNSLALCGPGMQLASPTAAANSSTDVCGNLDGGVLDRAASDYVVTVAQKFNVGLVYDEWHRAEQIAGLCEPCKGVSLPTRTVQSFLPTGEMVETVEELATWSSEQVCKYECKSDIVGELPVWADSRLYMDDTFCDYVCPEGYVRGNAAHGSGFRCLHADVRDLCSNDEYLANFSVAGPVCRKCSELAGGLFPAGVPEGMHYVQRTRAGVVSGPGTCELVCANGYVPIDVNNTALGCVECTLHCPQQG